MTKLLRSWVESANHEECEFPLNNLPCGVFDDGGGARCGVAIGDMILDVSSLGLRSVDPSLFEKPGWNALMAAGPEVWAAFRAEIVDMLAEGSSMKATAERHLVKASRAKLLMPFEVTEYTDFYSCRHHAENVGRILRGGENPLPANWLHIPVGYNGRASSVVVSGVSVRRPHGQIKVAGDAPPVFAPSRRFDFELEIGAIVGQPSDGPLSVARADACIFGYVLLNDWSARDIQAWEYQPLGPFQAKATATTISPWIVTKAALEPFRIPPPEREVELLEYLRDDGPACYDIDLELMIAPEGGEPTVVSRVNSGELYYSSAQQLAHHSSSGCPMRAGDLLGSGTISGAEKSARGSLLEISWGGKEPFRLDTGERRAFLEDGDTVMIRGAAKGDGYRIGFGPCDGTVLPA